MREYIIKYKAGTSPYWYTRSLYASGPDEALELFVIRRDLCPYNVRAIEIVEL